MNQVDELLQILELINKHNLPLSPILEYAIKERVAQYSGAYSDFEDPSQVDPIGVLPNSKGLDEYLIDFASLSVGVSSGKKLPHKAILLLSLIQLFEDGELEKNAIPLDKIIADAFVKCWEKYYTSKAPTVWTPFYHLKGEPFWHFKANGTDERLAMLLSFGGTPSIGKMRPVIAYAYLDEELFCFLKTKQSRDDLKSVLIKTYINQT